MDSGGLGTAAMLAVFLMPVVSLIKKPTWSRQVKYLVGMVAALICALAGTVIDGNVKSWGEFLAYFSVSLATSQTLYQMYFKDTEIEEKLENTELV
jgi:hypothetical protein